MRLGMKTYRYLCWLAVIPLIFLVVSYTEFLSPSPLEPVSVGASVLLSRPPSVGRTLLQAPTRSRYVIGLNYWEQLTMGVRSFFQLACISTLWNMSVVQPFQYNSRLYGLPNFKPDDNINASRNAEDLGLIFNIDSLNKLFIKTHWQSMSKFEAFLSSAHRRLTVIHFIHPSKEAHEMPVMRGETGTAIAQGFQDSDVLDCSTILARHGEMIAQSLNHELNKTERYGPRFRIERYYCVSMSVLRTPGELAKAVGLGDQNESVVVLNWRGTASKTVMVNTVKGNHTNNRIAMNSSCNAKNLAKHQALLSYSQLVEDTTTKFLQKQSLKLGGYVGVHIRSEKLGLRQPRFPKTLKPCLSKVSEVVERLGNRSFVYILDYGPYSSDTCRHCGSGEKTLKWLNEQIARPKAYWLRFNPLDFHLPEDSGLAAAVEATVLARASHLVVCGGGAFQTQIIERFSQRNSKKNIFKECTEDSDFSSVL